MRLLGEIVDDYRAEQGIMQRDERFYRDYRIAVNGFLTLMREVGNTEWNAKYQTIQPNDAGVFPMPEDYIELLFIGVCSGGIMRQFTARHDLCPPGVDSCGDYKKGAGLWYYHISHDGQDSYGRSVATSIKHPGFYKEFFDEGYILVKSGEFSIDNIIIVYRSTPQPTDAGDYLVPDTMEDAIKAYINKRKVWAGMKGNTSERAQAQNDYVIEHRKAMVMNNRISITEIVRTLRL